MSLRGRLTLVFALGTAALVVISGLVFLAQLRSSLNSALDDALRARSDVLAAQLRAGSLPAVASLGTGQTGQQTGQFGGADEFAQVLTRGGTAVLLVRRRQHQRAPARPHPRFNPPDLNNVLTGTPTQAGTFHFPMEVQDSQDNTVFATITVNINNR